MAIPAQYIVAINPRLIPAGSTDLEFNGLFLSDNALIPLSAPLMSFVDADSVADYFGEDSTEAKKAKIYFLGYNNSFAKPRRLIIGRRVSTAVGAYVRGGKYAGTLADLTSVTAGGLSITINSTDIALTSLDFSACTSLSEVATTLQTALQSDLAGTTCTYSSITKAFTIGSPSAGDSEVITYATGSVAELLNLTSANGAILSQGSDALSVDANMALLTDISQNWVTFTTLYTASNDEHTALSAWASAQGIEYCYIGHTADANLLVQGSTNSIADIIKEAGYGATALVYDNVDVAVFVLGAVASVNWERYQGSINYAFKKVDGVGATVVNQNDADLLLGKGVSFVGNFATRNDEFVFFYNGKMFGDYDWLDTFINTIWLKNAMQVAVMNGLASAGRVPYDDQGYTLIRAWLQEPINKAINNGTIDKGVVLSESQKAQVYAETGKDLTVDLFTNGYAIVIEDAGASVRVGRQSPNISLYYTYAGSVNKVDVASMALT